MLIVRSATTTIASQTKVHIQKNLGGKSCQSFAPQRQRLHRKSKLNRHSHSDQATISLSLGFSVFWNLLNTESSKHWCNSHRNGFFGWIVSSDEQVQTCSIQFAAWLSMFTSNNQPVASFSSKCFDASTFASSTATKSQKDCDIIPTARNQFNSATMFTRHQDTQPSTNAAQAKPVSWNLTQSQEMVLQTSKTLLRNIRSHWILLKRAKQLQKSKFSRDNKFLISSIVL